MTPGERTRLAIALLLAPPLIAFPMLRDLIRDPRLVSDRWDEILLFLILPFAAALILLVRLRRSPAARAGSRRSRARGTGLLSRLLRRSGVT